MLVDAKARELALNIKSKLIKAGAGSGKTGLLTNYFLKLLGLVECPTQIQAMTFTNKAGAEMRNRIGESLLKASTNYQPKNDFEAENLKLARLALKNSNNRGWNLEKNTSMLQISTIDSFCNQLLANRVGDKGTGFIQTISDEPNTIYRYAIQETLNLKNSGEYTDDIATLIGHFGNKIDRVEKMLIEMLTMRDRWIPILFSNKDEQRNELECQRQQYISILIEKPLAELYQFEPVIQSALSLLETQEPALTGFITHGFDKKNEKNIHVVNALKKLFLTSAGSPKKRFTVKDGIPKDINKDDKKYLVESLQRVALQLQVPLLELSFIPEHQFKETEWNLLRSAFNVMPLLLANLKLAFKYYGAVDFVEVSMNALEALNSESELATDKAINQSQRLKHILVDEYQDTNDIQTTMISMLIGHWSADDEKTLFLVGDAMQSLYGFRGANVNGFLKAEDGVGNQELMNLSLETNFRSVNGVVDWVNRVFANAFPLQNDLIQGASKYNPSASVKTCDYDNAVEVHGFVEDESGDRESIFVVDRIKHIHQVEPSAKIAVLGRTRSALTNVAELLESKDVVARDIDLNRIDKKPLPNLILATARLFIDEYDFSSLFTVLTSGLVGLSVAKVQELVHTSKKAFSVKDLLKPESLKLLDFDEHQRVNRFLEIFFEWKEAKETSEVRGALQHIFFGCHGNSLAKTISDQEDVKTTLEMFRGIQLHRINAKWLEDKIDSLYASPKSSQESEYKPVEMMTIHKSKGLEFDYVFIVGAHKGSMPNKSKMLNWSHIENGYASASVLASAEELGIQRDENSFNTFINKLQKKREYQELIRTAYVGVTRAIKQCIITANVNLTKDGEVKVSSSSLLSTIIKQCKDEVYFHENEGEVVSKESNNDFVTTLVHAPIDSQYPQRKTLAAYKSYDGAIKSNIVIGKKPNLTKPLGIIIHSFIEYMNKTDVSTWTEAEIKKRAKTIVALVREQNIERELQFTLVMDVRNKLIGLINDPSFIQLCGKHAKDDIEYPVTMKQGRNLVNLIIDKGFKDFDGQHYIVDWKSATIALNQSIEDFVKKQTSQYHEKMKLYAKAYGEINDGVSVSTNLFLTDIKQLAKCG